MAVTPGQGPQSQPAGPSQANATYSISNDYLYPRLTLPSLLAGDASFMASQRQGSPYRQGSLLRGFIYPVDVDSPGAVAGITAPEGESALSASEKARLEAIAANLAAEVDDPRTVEALSPVGASGVYTITNDPVKLPKKIRYAEGKQFQFNPFSVELSIMMIASAPPETGQQGGTASSQMVGSAETRVELYFDRSIETAAATRGKTVVSGHKVDPIFADIGVQKDLWDVYRIILGGDETYFEKVGGKLVNIDDVAGMTIRPGGGTDMFTRLFDFGLSGSKAWTRRIALYYNPNLVIIGEVTSMAFVYAEFNANYVPTKAKMDIGLLVFSTTSESGADAFNGATDTDTDTDTTGTDGSNGSDDGVENASQFTHTTTGAIVTTTNNSTQTNTYHVAGTHQTLAV